MNNVNYLYYLAVLTCLSFSCLLVFATVRQHFRRRKYRHIPGPPTNGILEFYFGNFNDILQCLRRGKTLADKYLEWSELYGPVFKFQFFGDIIVVTSEPNSIKEILVSKNFGKNPKLYHKIGFPYKERFMGLGLVTDTDEARWKIRRSIFNPGFHRSILLDCLKEFNNKTDILMEKLRPLADGKTEICLYKEINRLTLDIISSVAFGFTLDTINYPDNEFSHNITKSFEAVNRCLADPIFMWSPFTGKKKNEYKDIIRKLRQFAREKILNRIKDIENNEHVPDDILTTIIKACKQDEIELEALIDDFITFFNAGQETTANSLAFSFLELGKNRSAWETLKKEIDSVLGVRNLLTYEDMSKLEYTNCVIKETLRLWPPAPLISRLAHEEFYIDNFKIPKNTQINLSPYFSGRSSLFFDDPDLFRPERFLKENSSSLKNYTYFPFSIGPRNCIGQNFAVIESVVMIAKFVQNFDFTLVPGQSYDATLLTTLRPKDGTLCYLTIRNN